MQYKKDSIRNRIIEMGKAEYLENGFKGGNIRSIAECAGVPVGNLYRYFDGKAGLLDAIVSPVYNEIPQTIDKLAKLFISQNITFSEMTPVLAAHVMELFDKYGAEMMILAYGCEKTPYADFIDKIVSMVSKLIIFYMKTPPDEDQREFVNIISKSFVAMVFTLLKNGYERKKLGELLNKLIRYTFTDIYNRI